MVILTPIEDQASSSSASTHQSKSRYDVFLSFRGKDTRFTFTGNLYQALVLKGINTFMDDRELKIGDPLSPSLIKAIEESKISIVVLSENYASSKWCLEELCKILECMEKNNQLVWPIFYKVTPSDIRHQRNSYEKSLVEHEERFINETEKVVKWKSALSQVASLKGWEWHPEAEYEYQFIPMIVETVVTKLHRKLLDISENVIGHQSCLKKVKSLLDIESNNNVCMLGIHGIGGIGKTTLAKGLYNLIVDSFECSAFLGSVRERSIGYKKLLKLQEQLLSHLLKEKDIKFCSVDEGSIKIKNSLKNRKVLLVLDDVDKLEQLEKLAGGCDWFGSGSRIVITTRDKYLLEAHKVEKSYKMKLLNDHDSLELFCWNAFKMSQPAKGCEDVSNRVVEYANGLPLALKVIGCNLIGKSVQECECALEQYERIPDRKIHDILRVSYDCLEESAKSIFLDIACFFKGKELEYVEKILAACDFGPKYNIRVLVNKSLTTIEAGLLKMHDLIQDMGKEIVRQEAPSRPGKRSRLYCQEDVIRVLSENSGSSNIEGIMLDPLEEEEEVEWSGAAFEKMNNLRILIIRNMHFSVGPNYLPNNLKVLEWKQYPSKFLPSNFKPRKLVDLNLQDSCVLEKPFLQKQKHLAYMNLSNCKSITHVPDLSGVPSLRDLSLDRCDNLTEIHESVGFLKYLNYLSASECANLTSFSPHILLPSLGFLNFRGCKKLQHFPEIVGEMKNPLSLFLKDTGIEKLPHSIGTLTGLHLLQMGFSTSLRTMLCIEGSGQTQESFTRFQSMELPATRYSNLRKLYIRRGGLSDEDLHAILKCSPNLEVLDVPENDFVSIPACIKESVYLKSLDVSECLKLQEIPELPLSIEEVEARYCPSLTSETTSMLWSQAFKEVDKLQVMMPQSNIPDWFDHRCEGDTLSFWAREEFPIFAVAFVFRKKNPNMASPADYEGSMLHFYINGHRQGLLYHVSLIDDDQVLLCDIRKIPRPRRRELDKALKHSWILVEIKCDESANFAISECGAYVYKKTNMGHIQFNSPNQDVSTSDKGIVVYFFVLVIAVICSFIKGNIA